MRTVHCHGALLRSNGAPLKPKLRFAKLNTQDEPAPAARFNIRAIPTMIVFRSGKEIARQTGAMDLGSMQRWLSSVA